MSANKRMQRARDPDKCVLCWLSAMPGCLSYVVAKDATEADAIWITEIWESRERHRTSLSLPSVQQAITKGRPLIAGFAARFETQPIGGQGLRAA